MKQGDILPGFEMPESKPVPKPPTKPCTDCPYYGGIYSYFDDRTGEKFAVGHEFSDEDIEHLKTEDYDDASGDFVNCGVFDNRDVSKGSAIVTAIGHLDQSSKCQRASFGRARSSPDVKTRWRRTTLIYHTRRN